LASNHKKRARPQKVITEEQGKTHRDVRAFSRNEDARYVLAESPKSKYRVEPLKADNHYKLGFGVAITAQKSSFGTLEIIVGGSDHEDWQVANIKYVDPLNRVHSLFNYISSTQVDAAVEFGLVVIANYIKTRPIGQVLHLVRCSQYKVILSGTNLILDMDVQDVGIVSAGFKRGRAGTYTPRSLDHRPTPSKG
jgi:hypothetical protein